MGIIANINRSISATEKNTIVPSVQLPVIKIVTRMIAAREHELYVTVSLMRTTNCSYKSMSSDWVKVSGIPWRFASRFISCKYCGPSMNILVFISIGSMYWRQDSISPLSSKFIFFFSFRPESVRNHSLRQS